jgi:hypothetical protein
MHITHSFLPGLRFDTLWRYQTLTPSGSLRWAVLPLGHLEHHDVDPHGAWWCARRCAAVLGQHPWQSIRLPQAMPPHPCASEVGRVLGYQLPGWQVQHNEYMAQDPVPSCAQALNQGGSALLQMQLQSQGPGALARRIFWTWIVGVEWQQTFRRAWMASDLHAPAQPRCLLAVPFGLSMPWSSGYTARVQVNEEGHCQLDAIDGQWRESLCLATVTLAPPAPRPARRARPATEAGDLYATAKNVNT